MTFRQFAFAVVLGPFFAAFLMGCLSILPLMIVIAWLCGDPDPLGEAWEIVTEPPLEMFRECWRGLDQ